MSAYSLSTRFRVDALGRHLPPAGMADAARLYSERRLEQAASCCQAVLRDEPAHVEAHHLLGVVSLDLGRHEEARAALEQAVALGPRHARARYHLGNALQVLSRHEEAEASYRAALALAPGDTETLNNLGNSLRGQGRHEEAIACYGDVLGREPENPRALYNMGLSLTELDRLHEAETALRAALRAPVPPAEAHRRADVRDALSMVLVERGGDEEALATIRAGPGEKRAVWNESLILLRMGRWREAWPKYEQRWELPGFREGAEDRPVPPVLRLDAIAGKRVLLHAEQGRGDIIQFARYAPRLAACGAAVALSVFPDLVRLMRTLDGVEVVSADDPPPAREVDAALLSLPFAFDTEPQTVPANVPYLFADAALRAAWAARLGERRTPRVGLCWYGSQHIPQRSLALTTLMPLLAMSGVTFHALQKEIPDADAALLAAYGGIVAHSEPLTDFAETAALLAQLDLVITIDTAVAHLAGAMGLPTWLMLRRSADWRWLRERGDTPWYPTMRLFRQDQRGSWEPVVAAVATALREWLATR